MSTARLARIADQIQRELSELVREELRDPRVKMVTITGVEVSRDQSHAKVWFTTLGSPEDAKACDEGLARAATTLRDPLSIETLRLKAEDETEPGFVRVKAATALREIPL